MTPQRAFRPVILDELRRNGGEASIDQVYAAVRRCITLLAGDHECVAGGEPRWNNAVRQEARAMRAERLLARICAESYLASRRSYGRPSLVPRPSTRTWIGRHVSSRGWMASTGRVVLTDSRLHISGVGVGARAVPSQLPDTAGRDPQGFAPSTA